MTPTRLQQLPLGTIRAAIGAGRCVLLVQPALFLHLEVAKMAAVLSPADQARRYWLFDFPAVSHDTTGAEYRWTLPTTGPIRASAYESYDAAEAEYERLAKTSAGKVGAAMGFKGLTKVGSEE